MKNLILDCSCGMNIYVVCDDKSFSKIDSTQNKHTDNVLLVVHELLNQANLKIGDIENICVCVGPGSFTGVRVAISIAKGLSFGTHARLFVLSNFDVFMKNKNENSYYVLDGFSNNIYVRSVFNHDIKDECLTVEEFKEKNVKLKLPVFVQLEKTKLFLSKYDIDSTVIINDIENKFAAEIENNNCVEINRIEPIYLRASQAEIERQKKI